MATGGLTVAVILCLVAAISLLNSTPPQELAGDDQPAPDRSPIKVASTGEVSHLLNEPPAKPVPDPVDHLPSGEPVPPPEQFASSQPDLPRQWAPRPDGDEPHYEELPSQPDSPSDSIANNSSSPSVRIPIPTTDLESDLAQLKGQVNELARTQLEAQLTEIRHAEQLLSSHQTQRMIEALQREVDELKQQQADSNSDSAASPESVSTGPSASIPQIDDESPLHESSELREPVQNPVGTDSVEAASPPGSTIALPEPVSVPLARVRFRESTTTAGRYDVDADQASLEEFLATLGPVAGWNLVNGPELKGSVTFRWKDVELKQALVQVLRVRGQQIRQDGDFAIIETLPSTSQGEPVSEGPITLQLAPDSSRGNSSLMDGESTAPNPLLVREVHGVHSPLPLRTELIEPQPQNFSSPSKPASPRRGRLVMKDYPEFMEASTSSHTSADHLRQRFEIEAITLQSRLVSGVQPRAFRQALTAEGQGACPRCREVHIGATHEVGHSSGGWVNLGDGISAGVCLMTPELITTKLQQLAATSVTSTPRVPVLDRQQAVIDLTELQGFHRRSKSQEGASISEGTQGSKVQISLRPTVVENGQIRLDLHPTSPPAGEFNASLIVPPESCVVVGGLFFESAPTSASADHPLQWGRSGGDQPIRKELFEVVVLIRVRLLSNTATAENPGLPVTK